MSAPALHRRVIDRDRVKALWESGVPKKRIARDLGISLSQTRRILDPAFEERQRCVALAYKRRALQGKGACAECGAPVSKQFAADTTTRCSGCAVRANTVWTRETIVAAIHLFAARYGRAPHAPDFSPAQARSTGHHQRAERFYADGDYPTTTSVVNAFGTWNTAIIAAGFAPLERGGHYDRSRVLS